MPPSKGPLTSKRPSIWRNGETNYFDDWLGAARQEVTAWAITGRVQFVDDYIAYQP